MTTLERMDTLKKNAMKLVRVEFNEQSKVLKIKDHKGLLIDTLYNARDRKVEECFETHDDMIYSHYKYYYGIDLQITKILGDDSSLNELYVIAVACTNYARLIYCMGMDEQEIIDLACDDGALTLYEENDEENDIVYSINIVIETEF